MAADFNAGDVGVVINLYPISPIPSTITKILMVFRGQKTASRVEVTATSQNNGQYAQYTTIGSDFQVPDSYIPQLVQVGPGTDQGSVTYSAPIVVQPRE